MGATVLTSKAAAAFARPDTGEVVYVLFEKTYEKNCHPHDPQWSCIFIGNYKQSMHRVLQHAADCEGGMFQARSGWIAPENYIRHWQQLLKKPVSIDNTDILLDATQIAGWHEGGERKAAFERASEVLEQHGRAKLFEEITIAKKSIRLNLHDDIDLVLALYGQDGIMRPWRALDHVQVQWDNPPEPGLGFADSTEFIEVPPHNIWRLAADGEELVGQIGDEPIHLVGWTYSAVGKFIMEKVFPLEMKQTGVARKLIQGFREACKVAVPPPRGTMVTINVDAAAHAWNKEEATKIAQAVGSAGESIFTCTIGEIEKAEMLNRIKYLSNEQVTFEIPAANAKVTGSPDLSASSG